MKYVTNAHGKPLPANPSRPQGRRYLHIRRLEIDETRPADSHESLCGRGRDAGWTPVDYPPFTVHQSNVCTQCSRALVRHRLREIEAMENV